MTPDEKLDALIKNIKEIDKKDMKLHNKKFKHVLFHQTSVVKLPKNIFVLNEDLIDLIDIKYLHIFDHPKKAIKLATRLCGRSLIVYLYRTKTQIKFRSPILLQKNARMLKYFNKEMIWDHNVPRPTMEIINNEGVVTFELYSKLNKKEIDQLADKLKHVSLPVRGGALKKNDIITFTMDPEPAPQSQLIEVVSKLDWITGMQDMQDLASLLKDAKSVNIKWNKPPEIVTTFNSSLIQNYIIEKEYYNKGHTNIITVLLLITITLKTNY